MKALVLFCFFSAILSFSQHPNLVLKLDSTTQKYGYVNSQNKYVIPPTFDFGHNFISPEPFKQISDSINILELEKLPDGKLILRVLEMSKTFCHYYERFRIYNMVALNSDLATKWTIEYGLNNSTEVVKWINEDKKFEVAFKDGEIDCCRSGPIWYGPK